MHNVCSVHREMFSTSVRRGNTMSTSGVFSTLGGYNDACGEYDEYIGDVQYIGGSMSTLGGYHEYIGGCSVHQGIS